MIKLTFSEFEDIMNKDDFTYKWTGDKALKGLLVISKYISMEENRLIEGAGSDMIYSVDIDRIINAGITKEDTTELNNLGWFIEDSKYLAHYV